MKTKKKSKPGAKYPKGYTKKRILLVVLDHLEGIQEPFLRDEMKRKLDLGDNKGIKQHLMDLKETEFLDKECELGKENIWRPKMDENTFKKIAKWLLEDEEMAVLFVKTRYMDKLFDKYVYPNLDLGGVYDGSVYPFWDDKDLEELYPNLNRIVDGGDIDTFLRGGLKLSPTATLHIYLSHVPEVKVGVAMMTSMMLHYMGRSPGKVPKVIDTLFFSLLIDRIKYPELKTEINQFFESHTEFLSYWYEEAYNVVYMVDMLLIKGDFH